MRDTPYQRVLELPDRRVHDARLPKLLTALLQGLDAVGPVVVQLSIRRLDRVRRAAAAQARQGEMVVQCQDLLSVVEALDILSRFGEVLWTIDVLHHVHVAGYLLEPPVVVEKVVEEVHVPHVVRGAVVLVDLARLRKDDVHKLAPGVAFDWHDHFVDVEQCYVPGRNWVS